jgi:hypothetical protein
MRSISTNERPGAPHRCESQHRPIETYEVRFDEARGPLLLLDCAPRSGALSRLAQGTKPGRPRSAWGRDTWGWSRRIEEQLRTAAQQQDCARLARELTPAALPARTMQRGSLSSWLDWPPPLTVEADSALTKFPPGRPRGSSAYRPERASGRTVLAVRR